MKRLIVSIMFTVLLASFAFAANNQNSDTPPMPSLISSAGNQNQEQNSAEIKIQKQQNNRFQIHSNNVSAECEETCNLTQEQVQNKTKLKMKLSNGRNAEIKIMPDTASETALARLRLKVCNESNNCTIQLKEVGKGNETRPAYEIQVQRHFKLLAMFRLKSQTKAQIDAETGEVIAIKKPWWAFLATEPEETEEKASEEEDVQSTE